MPVWGRALGGVPSPRVDPDPTMQGRTPNGSRPPSTPTPMRLSMIRMRKPRWLAIAAALAAVVSVATPALAGDYRFVVVADHERDGFNAGSFAGASINQHGEVAFKAARTVPGGFDFFDGTYR